MKTWQAQLFVNGDGIINTENLENLTVLTVQVHLDWDNGLCAFCPLSVNSDETRMDLAFHWFTFAF